jgi:hypothetical protein
MNFFQFSKFATKTLVGMAGQWVVNKLGSLIVGYSPDIRVTDEGFWSSLVQPAGPQDRRWAVVEKDLKDAIEAWRENFLVRQLVRLQSAYVVGDDGIQVSSKRPQVQKFIEQFWDFKPETDDGRLLPANDISQRIIRWNDELQRSGEIFVILYTNPLTGMSQVREKPACVIYNIETDPDDYEKELYYWEKNSDDPLNPIKWSSSLIAEVDEPVMLHYSINKPVGATRGESDVIVILPWALRYTEWLKDRIRFNRIRNRLAIAELSTSGDVKKRQQDFMANDAVGSGNIFVTKMNEESLKMHSANIQAQDAEADGRAQRLAIVSGMNVPLHFLGEGDGANRATAIRMDDPTHRWYRQRQNSLKQIASDLCNQAYRRKVDLNLATMPMNRDLKILADCQDVSREDNKFLAEAANLAADVMTKMKTQGWVDDETSIRLIFKFLGENIEESAIKELLEEMPEGELNARKNGHFINHYTNEIAGW